MIINEIFYSIQGESTRAGLPCVFVRLTACNLRCVYCDTAHAFHEGDSMTIEEIVTAVAAIGCRFVTITGGEPLLQEEVYPLMDRLAGSGYDLQLETSGAVDISRVGRRARVIMDIKTPGSRMLHEMNWDNLERLKQGDEVKFVLMGREDYEWARDVIRTRPLPAGIPVLMSPAHGALEPSELAEWMKRDHIAARLQLQIHKYIWGPDRRGV
ncbi:MAG TPA: radical SAM protein [Patescibacteria group bacterium]|jgi:7-carboxy-7-deazaguanine synthase|nr:radical SAM protein [Patescibacteria group bacterium]